MLLACGYAQEWIQANPAEVDAAADPATSVLSDVRLDGSAWHPLLPYSAIYGPNVGAEGISNIQVNPSDGSVLIVVQRIGNSITERADENGQNLAPVVFAGIRGDRAAIFMADGRMLTRAALGQCGREFSPALSTDLMTFAPDGTDGRLEVTIPRDLDIQSISLASASTQAVISFSVIPQNESTVAVVSLNSGELRPIVGGTQPAWRPTESGSAKIMTIASARADICTGK